MKKSIIFDFDGVIIDTSSIKTEAFYKLFSRFGKKIGTIAKNYHLENEGISRFEKFTYIKKKYLIKKNKTVSNNYLNEKYSNIVLNKIVKKKISYGFLSFIKNNFNNYNFFISSSSPEDELKYIIKKKKITKFFKYIYGYPPVKKNQIKKIIKLNNLDIKNVWYVGDTNEDFKVSKSLKISFMGYVKYGNKFKYHNINIIKNFDEISLIN